MGESEDEGSAEGGRRLPQWPKQKRIRKVLCGDPQAALRSLATFQDADCMQPYYREAFRSVFMGGFVRPDNSAPGACLSPYEMHLW